MEFQANREWSNQLVELELISRKKRGTSSKSKDTRLLGSHRQADRGRLSLLFSQVKGLPGQQVWRKRGREGGTWDSSGVLVFWCSIPV